MLSSFFQISHIYTKVEVETKKSFCPVTMWKQDKKHISIYPSLHDSNHTHTHKRKHKHINTHSHACMHTSCLSVWDFQIIAPDLKRAVRLCSWVCVNLPLSFDHSWWECGDKGAERRRRGGRQMWEEGVKEGLCVWERERKRKLLHWFFFKSKGSQRFPFMCKK